MKNKKIKILIIIILCVVTIAISIVFTKVLFGKMGKLAIFRLDFGPKVSDNLVIDETYTDIFDMIDIDSKAGDIGIYRGNDDEIKIKIYGDKKDITVKDEKNRLNITTSTKGCIGICLNFSLTIPKIEVYLPNDYTKNLKIKNNFGDIEIGEFPYMTIDTYLNFGDIEVASVKSGKIKNDYGDIVISKYAEYLDIDQNCGNIKVGEVDDLKIENKYGDIEVEKINTRLDIDEKCGDIKLGKVYVDENSKITNSLGDIAIFETSEIYIDAKTELGDIKINNNYKDSNITLIIDDSLGDIIVDN